MAYSFDSRIRYSEVDAACRLSLTGLTNYFQDCSVFHSQSHDVGIRFLADNHIAWVLSSWQICINKLPLLNEQVKISTWAYGMKAFYGYRNFKMEDAGGNLLAYANSVWVLVNTQTGRPVKVPQEFADTYGLEPQLEMDCAKRKIQIPDDMKQNGEIVVPQFFIDSNQHMNNEKYIMLAQQQLPAGFEISELRVEYRKEAKLGDTIISFVKAAYEQVTVVLADEDKRPYAVVAFLKKPVSDKK